MMRHESTSVNPIFSLLAVLNRSGKKEPSRRRNRGSLRGFGWSLGAIVAGAVCGFLLFQIPQKTTEVQTGPLGDLAGVTSVGVDPVNRVYLGGSFGVKVLTPDWRILRSWSTPETITALDGDPDGNVYVAYLTKVEKFDRAGKSLLTWGKGGCDGDPFAYVSGIDVLDGNVFVADAGSRVVFHFTTDGKYLNEIGDKERGPDGLGLVLPTPFLDCSAVGTTVYINNPGKTRVETYDLDGKILGFWGKGGGKINEFPGCCNPTNIAILRNGKTVVSQKGDPCVKVYSSDGEFEATFGRGVFPEACKGIDLADDDAGRIYAVDKISGCVRVFEVTNK